MAMLKDAQGLASNYDLFLLEIFLKSEPEGAPVRSIQFFDHDFDDCNVVLLDVRRSSPTTLRRRSWIACYTSETGGKLFREVIVDVFCLRYVYCR
jgi:hypothetical protein